MENIYRLLISSLAAFALMSLSACASSDFFTNNPSPLPLEAIDGTHGDIASTRAFETDDRLYVTGHMKKPRGRHIPTSAHVDVQLIGENGHVLAEKQHDIEPVHPRTFRAQTGRYSYVASFPLEQARQASKIRVSYHLESHGA